MRFRRSNAERLLPANAKRQGHITNLALATLGRENAIIFLNSQNDRLGARPLDRAIESDAGCAEVEAEIQRLGQDKAPA